MQRSLRWKQRLIGSPLEPALARVRWLAGARHRRRHPELWALHLENRYLQLALLTLIDADTNCIDGGAHIGSMLAVFRHLAPRGHHLAFEPVRDKARLVQDRWPDVEVHAAALGAAPGTATFHENRRRSGFSGLRADAGTTDADVAVYEVPVVTLDDVIGQRTVGFVKLDLEGGEYHALQGGAALLARCRPALVLECNTDATLAALGWQRADLWDLLHDAGYDLRSVADHVFGRPPMGRDEFSRGSHYPFTAFNYIAVTAGTEVTRIL